MKSQSNLAGLVNAKTSLSRSPSNEKLRLKSSKRAVSRSGQRSRASESDRSLKNLNKSSPPIYPKKKVIKKIVKRRVVKNSQSVN